LNDFLLSLGRLSAESLALLLKNRPGVERHPCREFTFPWGALAVQPSTLPGYEPLVEGGVTVACVGRPRFVGVEHESLGPSGFLKLAFRYQDVKSLSAALTGPYAIIWCDAGGARLLTDQMGFVPVYVGRDHDGRVIALGSTVETTASAAGRTTDFDPLSLGELLSRNVVTFPFTTRRGVTELEPASLTTISTQPNGATASSTTLWLPSEPSHWDEQGALDDAFEEALRFAGRDVTRGVERAAVMLSGGLDSRLVACAVPEAQRAGAVTFATRENRELFAARRVAEAMRLDHRVAFRSPEFYAELDDRVLPLVGSELRADGHGFAIVDSALENAFDLLLGGYLSDTFFKGHFMSNSMKARFRPQSPVARLKNLARRAGLLKKLPDWASYRMLASQAVTAMRPEIQSGIELRRELRLDQVRAVRPLTAEEWIHFWPVSRQDDAAAAWVNLRLFPTDELFMHKSVVELARVLPWADKCDGRVATRVFPRFYGSLARIINANTGKPVAGNASSPAEAAPSALAPSNAPWNDVEHSWVDYPLLMTKSPRFQAARDALRNTPALDVWQTVMKTDMRPYLEGYREEGGVLVNRMAMQLTRHLHRALTGSRAGDAAA
jgi:hypothetical protein